MKTLTTLALLFNLAAYSQDITKTKWQKGYAYLNGFTTVFTPAQKSFKNVGAGMVIGAQADKFIGIGAGIEFLYTDKDLPIFAPYFAEIRLQVPTRHIVPFVAYQGGGIIYKHSYTISGTTYTQRGQYFSGGNAGFYFPEKSFLRGLAFSISYRDAQMAYKITTPQKNSVETYPRNDWWFFCVGYKF